MSPWQKQTKLQSRGCRVGAEGTPCPFPLSLALKCKLLRCILSASVALGQWALARGGGSENRSEENDSPTLPPGLGPPPWEPPLPCAIPACAPRPSLPLSPCDYSPSSKVPWDLGTSAGSSSWLCQGPMFHVKGTSVSGAPGTWARRGHTPWPFHGRYRPQQPPMCCWVPFKVLMSLPGMCWLESCWGAGLGRSHQ